MILPLSNMSTRAAQQKSAKRCTRELPRRSAILRPRGHRAPPVVDCAGIRALIAPSSHGSAGPAL
eukprot:1427047-Pyramimonas_sp.AAC.1